MTDVKVKSFELSHKSDSFEIFMFSCNLKHHSIQPTSSMSSHSCRHEVVLERITNSSCSDLSFTDFKVSITVIQVCI